MEVENLTWIVRLGAVQPARVAVIGLFALAAAVLGFVLFRSPLSSLLGFAIIAGSTSEYWLGVRYRLDRNGASARVGLSTSAIAWTDVKRILVNESGVTLSPLESETRLAPFRGIYLRFGALGRDELLAAIHDFGGDDVRHLG